MFTATIYSIGVFFTFYGVDLLPSSSAPFTHGNNMLYPQDQPSLVYKEHIETQARAANTSWAQILRNALKILVNVLALWQ